MLGYWDRAMWSALDVGTRMCSSSVAVVHGSAAPREPDRRVRAGSRHENRRGPERRAASAFRAHVDEVSERAVRPPAGSKRNRSDVVGLVTERIVASRGEAAEPDRWIATQGASVRGGVRELDIGCQLLRPRITR